VRTAPRCGPAFSLLSVGSRKWARLHVSIIVSVYSEEYLLADSLAALQQQDYAGTYEIIAVDNASTDHSPDIARAIGVRVLEEPRKGSFMPGAQALLPPRERSSPPPTPIRACHRIGYPAW
jgi:cellulose synthase/poly-beta-1,6-N-acetylglucosamine synthase-like glycosyltransferase